MSYLSVGCSLYLDISKSAYMKKKSTPEANHPGQDTLYGLGVFKEDGILS